jgi:hypothetical protein
VLFKTAQKSFLRLVSSLGFTLLYSKCYSYTDIDGPRGLKEIEAPRIFSHMATRTVFFFPTFMDVTYPVHFVSADVVALEMCSRKKRVLKDAPDILDKTSTRVSHSATCCTNHLVK